MCKILKSLQQKITSKQELVSSFVTLLALIVFIAAVYYSTAIMLEERYQNAVNMINQKKWYQAEQVLKTVSNYKDAAVLKRYVLANIEVEFKSEQELGESHYISVLNYLNQIPDNYQGKFKSSICKFKNMIIQKRDKYHKKFAVQNLLAKNDCTVENKVKMICIGDRYLYFEKELIEPIFDDLLY